MSLSSGGVKIKIENVNTNEITIFNSKTDAAKFLEVSNRTIGR
jgi:hypothetical protein